MRACQNTLQMYRHAVYFSVYYDGGAIIVDGIKTGLYEGYDHEISEVFVYKVS